VVIAAHDQESLLLFSLPIRMRVTSMAQVHLPKGLIAVAIREMPESLTGRPTAVQGQNQSQGQDCGSVDDRTTACMAAASIEHSRDSKGGALARE
jgi:hypothetical protein